jgi:DNA-binding MarR family transcriptional regulator
LTGPERVSEGGVSSEEGAGQASLPVLSYMLGRLNVALGHALSERLDTIGVTRAEYGALAALRMKSGLSNAQLARRVLITPQSMSEVVATLERKGLIRRWNDPEHARILRAELTDTAWAVLQKCDEATLELEAQMQAEMTPHERELVLSGITECVRQLGAWVDPPHRSTARSVS